MDEGHAGPVYEAVGHDRRGNLAMQRVRGDLRGEPVTHDRREIAAQLFCEFGQLRQCRRPGAPRTSCHLGVSEQHRELRPHQAAPLRRTGSDRLVIGQEFQRTVQPAAAFEVADHAQLAIERERAAGFCDRQRLPLQIIVTQHHCGDIAGHRGKQWLAFLGGERRRQRSPDRAGS